MPVKENDEFPPPPDLDAPIWRYMDFTKFLSMLENQELFFSRVDCLGDPFEGSIPVANLIERTRIRGEEFPSIPHAIDEAMADWLRPRTFVNCWHLNKYESAAMWKLYSSTDYSIAVRSTFRKLRDCLDQECFVGMITYKDYFVQVVPGGNTFRPFMHKQVSYSHEQEVRALVQRAPMRGMTYDFEAPAIEAGIIKSVDLEKLILSIYVGPFCPAWYGKLVRRVVERYGLKVHVTDSFLDRRPPS
jgi:hypothetical protein